MEALFGITGKNFVLLAADDMCAHSIVIMKKGEDKTRSLNKHNVMMFSGEAGDTVNFAEYIKGNIQLYSIRNGIELSPDEVAKYTRRELADALRTRNSYRVNLLLAGFDVKTGKPSLYWMDHLSSMAPVPFAVHGYGGYFCNSLMDRYWHAELTLPEALALLKKCVQEMKTRFTANFEKFMVKVVDKDGVRVVEL